MRTLCITIALFFVSAFSFAKENTRCTGMPYQKTFTINVRQNIPVMSLKLFTKSNAEIPDRFAIACMELYREGKTEPFQKLTIPVGNYTFNYPFYGTNKELIFSTQNSADGFDPSGNIINSDHNFDGYRDISVISSLFAKGAIYSYWLWDKKLGRFVYNKLLSAIPNASLDEKTKTISTYISGGMSGLIFQMETYGFENGRPILLEKITEVQTTPSSDRFRYKVIRRVKGQMQTIESKVFTHDEAVKHLERDTD